MCMRTKLGMEFKKSLHHINLFILAVQKLFFKKEFIYYYYYLRDGSIKRERKRKKTKTE